MKMICKNKDSDYCGQCQHSHSHEENNDCKKEHCNVCNIETECIGIEKYEKPADDIQEKEKIILELYCATCTLMTDCIRSMFSNAGNGCNHLNTLKNYLQLYRYAVEEKAVENWFKRPEIDTGNIYGDDV